MLGVGQLHGCAVIRSQYGVKVVDALHEANALPTGLPRLIKKNNP